MRVFKVLMIQSFNAVVSLSDVTEESLEVWRALPEKIRQDPSLASFRRKNEKLLGKLEIHKFRWQFRL
jgi:hypothetical protein